MKIKGKTENDNPKTWNKLDINVIWEAICLRFPYQGRFPWNTRGCCRYSRNRVHVNSNMGIKYLIETIVGLLSEAFNGLCL